MSDFVFEQGDGSDKLFTPWDSMEYVEGRLETIEPDRIIGLSNAAIKERSHRWKATNEDAMRLSAWYADALKLEGVRWMLDSCCGRSWPTSIDLWALMSAYPKVMGLEKKIKDIKKSTNDLAGWAIAQALVKTPRRSAKKAAIVAMAATKTGRRYRSYAAARAAIILRREATALPLANG